jgi:hypothetical protein
VRYPKGRVVRVDAASGRALVDGVASSLGWIAASECDTVIPRVGAPVRVLSMSRLGTLESVHPDRFAVQVRLDGGMRRTVERAFEDVCKVAPELAKDARPKEGGGDGGGVE